MRKIQVQGVHHITLVGAKRQTSIDFWEAEPEHQNYLEHYPNGYTCHFVRPDWVLPERTKVEAG